MGDELMGDIHAAGMPHAKEVGVMPQVKAVGYQVKAVGVMQQVKATKGSAGRQWG